MEIPTQVLALLASLPEEADAAALERLAAERGLTVEATAEALDWLARRGLCVRSEAPFPALVTEAGQQWLDGLRIDDGALRFLPHHVDDLRARAALVAATQAVDAEFCESLAAGGGVGYALQLVPDAFVPAVDPLLATRLYAALVAVIARLTAGRPAACVAEELMAVALISEATSVLEDAVDAGRLDEDDFEVARSALSGIFELFEDDDVLMLFEMTEPADAAMAGHDPANRSLGVVDQRVESWFVAFGPELVAGHLMGRSADG